MKIAMFSEEKHKEFGITWFRAGTDISYKENEYKKTVINA